MARRLTEAEAWALDDYVTNNDIELGPDGSGFLSLRESRLQLYELGLDKQAITWLEAKAAVSRQSVGKVINTLVHREMAAAEMNARTADLLTVPA